MAEPGDAASSQDVIPEYNLLGGIARALGALNFGCDKNRDVMPNHFLCNSNWQIANMVSAALAADPIMHPKLTEFGASNVISEQATT